MKWSVLCAGMCLGLGASVAVNAADTGWYIGASVGLSDSGYSTSEAQADFGYNSSVHVDSTDVGSKLFGGYRSDKNWGVEFGFVELGETKISGNVGSGPGTPSADKLKASGVNLDGTYTWSFGQSFSLTGKAGVANVKGEYICVDLCAGISNQSKTRIVPTVGVGIQYDFTKQFGMRAEFEEFASVKYESTGPLKADYNMVSVGLVYKF